MKSYLRANTILVFVHDSSFLNLALICKTEKLCSKFKLHESLKNAAMVHTLRQIYVVAIKFIGFAKKEAIWRPY